MTPKSTWTRIRLSSIVRGKKSLVRNIKLWFRTMVISKVISLSSLPASFSMPFGDSPTLKSSQLAKDTPCSILPLSSAGSAILTPLWSPPALPSGASDALFSAPPAKAKPSAWPASWAQRLELTDSAPLVINSRPRWCPSTPAAASVMDSLSKWGPKNQWFP